MSSFWSDPVVRRLPREAKLLFLYLITCEQSNYSGLYVLDWVLAPASTGLSNEEATGAFLLLQREDRVAWDADRQVVFVRHMLRHQFPGGRPEYVLQYLTRHLNSLHSSPLILEFLQSLKDQLPGAYAAVAERLKVEWSPSPSATVPEPFNNRYPLTVAEPFGNGTSPSLSVFSSLPDKERRTSYIPPDQGNIIGGGRDADDRAARFADLKPWASKRELLDYLRIHRKGADQPNVVIALYLYHAGYTLESLPSRGSVDAYLREYRGKAMRLLELAGDDIARIKAAFKKLKADPFWSSRAWDLDVVVKKWYDIPRLVPGTGDVTHGCQKSATTSPEERRMRQEAGEANRREIAEEAARHERHVAEMARAGSSGGPVSAEEAVKSIIGGFQPPPTPDDGGGNGKEGVMTPAQKKKFIAEAKAGKHGGFAGKFYTGGEVEEGALPPPGTKTKVPSPAESFDIAGALAALRADTQASRHVIAEYIEIAEVKPNSPAAFEAVVMANVDVAHRIAMRGYSMGQIRDAMASFRMDGKADWTLKDVAKYLKEWLEGNGKDVPAVEPPVQGASAPEPAAKGTDPFADAGYARPSKPPGAPLAGLVTIEAPGTNAPCFSVPTGALAEAAVSGFKAEAKAGLYGDLAKEYCSGKDEPATPGGATQPKRGAQGLDGAGDVPVAVRTPGEPVLAAKGQAAPVAMSAAPNDPLSGGLDLEGYDGSEDGAEGPGDEGDGG